jgi:hypothetical protein
MESDPDDVRTHYRLAAHSFASLAASVDPGHWTRPALGVWDLRSLVGHASRALLTVEAYVHAAATTDAPTLADAVAYFLASTAALADPVAVADRGRQAGVALGERPADKVAEIVERVLALVDQRADDALVATPVGAMTLAGYLPTRTFELTVHSLDIARAADLDPPPDLGGPIASSLSTAADLAVARGGAGDALLALTGRRALPAGWSVI